MNATIEGRLVRTDSITIPDNFERSENLIEDDALRRSIQHSGIQQPLVLATRPDGNYTLIDGSRRLQIARQLDLPAVPAVIDTIPEGAELGEYQNRLRFVLDTARQDLLHTQRAALITKLMKLFSLSQKDVAAYLGIDEGSVSNWRAIDDYIEPVRRAIDTGQITLFHGRMMDGLSERGQERVWRSHRKEIAEMSGAKAHKFVRSTYPPNKVS